MIAGNIENDGVSYFDRFFGARKYNSKTVYLDYATIPSDLKKLILIELDHASSNALSLTNKSWNLEFQKIFPQNLQVKAIYAHVNQLQLKPDFVEQQLLKKTTVESVNTLAKWIMARDTLIVRNLMAKEVLSEINYVLARGLLDDVEGKEDTKILLEGARSDPDFVSDLAIDPKNLKSFEAYFLHSQQLEDDSPLKNYIPMIETLDLSDQQLASISQDFALLENVFFLAGHRCLTNNPKDPGGPTTCETAVLSFKINNESIICNDEELNLSEIKEVLGDAVLDLDFESFHYKK